MQVYIALLRGINVGGRNIIKMADLRECLEESGLSDVRTYIQSGNVIFRSDEADRDQVLKQMTAALFDAFDYSNPVNLFPFEDLNRVIAEAPDGYGEDSSKYKYDLLFLMRPLSAPDAIDKVPVRDQVDVAWEGPGVIYYRRSADHLTKSMLNKLPSKPVYQQMTIRNWRTTNKVYDIAQELSG